MSCEHCDHIRRRQEAVIAEHGDDRYVGMYCSSSNSDPMTAAIAMERWGSDFTGDLAASLPTCNCGCHDIARHFGSLPKLIERAA